MLTSERPVLDVPGTAPAGARLRVLWVSHLIPYPPKAGVLLRSFHLVRELSRHVDLDLACFIQGAWLRLCFGDPVQGLEIARRELAAYCNPRAFLPIPCEHKRFGHARLALSTLTGGPCFTVRWLQSTRAEDTFRELARTGKYDVVHFDTISLAQYRHLFPDARATLGHHNIESHMLQRRVEFEGNPLKAWFFGQEGRRLRQYERDTAAAFEFHVTCSHLDSDRLREIAPDVQTIEVPNGVDTDYFKPQGGAVVSNTLVFVATMDIYSNADAMRFFTRDVWPSLKARRSGITLGIVGRNPPQWLRDLAEADPSVRVYGYVDDVRPYIEGADLYVCPVRDGGGTRLKILDALAMRKCVVAHPVGSEGIDVTDGKDVVFATEPHEFVDLIVQLLDDPARAAAIAAAGRSLAVNRYDFRMVGERFARQLESLGRERT